LRTDPAIDARRRSAQQTYLAQPETKAKLAAQMRVSHAIAMQNPDFKAWQRENGRRLQRDILSSPEIRATMVTPSAKAKRGAAVTETRLGWCPVDQRQHYRDLIRRKGLSAAEARAIIEASIRPEPNPVEQAREAIAEIMRKQIERQRRDKMQAY